MRVAILEIERANIERGFEVSLEIRDERGSPAVRLLGQLPPQTHLDGLYECWKQSFRRAIALSRHNHASQESESDDWHIDESLPTHRATSEGIEACRQCVRALESELRLWLQTSSNESWMRIRDRLLEELLHTPELRLVVQARDIQLWKLPWHVWELLAKYPQVGLGYSFPEFESPPKEVHLAENAKVRILSVLGESENLDLTADREAIAQLENAESRFLEQPTARELIQTLRQGWQIFFFAGHSKAERETGRIYLSDRESLTVEDFQNALTEAVRKGLKIAIFNSCEGLGLVQQLHNLHIPVAIVMQEVVPDAVAQSFLKEFLQEYAGGRSLYAAVRMARERLEAFAELPGCTWLPLIYQNPTEVPLAWEELRPRRPWWRSVTTGLAASLAVTGLVMGMRWMGALQSVELEAYDRFMRARPEASSYISKHLLIVGINEADIRTYNYPLSDETLAQLLDKLEQYEPVAIGLDIYRDLPVRDGRERLAAHLEHNPRLVTVCMFSTTNAAGVNPPPESPLGQTTYVNVPLDPPHHKIRRYILSRTPNSTSTFNHCDTEYSLGLDLAFRYLDAKGYPVDSSEGQGPWQLGDLTLPRMTSRTGGYQKNFDARGYQKFDARGYQIPIGYRTFPQIARQVTVAQVLSDRVKASWVRDKIVLIGVTADSVPDEFNTPIGQMRGLFVHAHLIDSLLGAVLDRRALLWWLPQWGDALLVGIAALLGGGLAEVWGKSPGRLGVALSSAIALLSGFYFWIFILGGWLPWIPSILALVGTGGLIWALRTRQHR